MTKIEKKVDTDIFVLFLKVEESEVGNFLKITKIFSIYNSNMKVDFNLSINFLCVVVEKIISSKNSNDE